MFEKFGPSSTRTLLFSRQEAARLGCSSVRPEAILLGILDERDPVLLHCLGQFGQTFTMLRERTEHIWRESNSDFVTVGADVIMPLSEDAKKILATAAYRAESKLHPVVKPGHMLWAMADIVPELLESLFGQVPGFLEDELDDNYLGLPDRLDVPLVSKSASPPAAMDKLQELVQEFELAFKEKRFAEVLPLNERIETLRTELGWPLPGNG